MKLVQFKYEKSATDISNRVAFMISKPSKVYAMLEVVDDCGTEIAEIEAELKAEYDRHAAKIKELSANYALAYKNFSEDKVKNLEAL